MKVPAPSGRVSPTREMPPPLPCLSEYAEEDWFEEDSEKKAYFDRLSRVKILPPKYVGEGAIPEDKYPEFWRLIDVQGLRHFLLQREGLLNIDTLCCCGTFSECGYFSRFVAATFATVIVEDTPTSSPLRALPRHGV
ncbi:hypothetical protein PIB30_049900 [Stylosanthes scabra]|uniref:Uncharacterized protein n=1 Tax=Stylosanthes scabra TaxID=79078 RepID=A0ABU6YJ93_9FABA|nr:hypothetical protein [Stylosanthes scabra]